MDSGDLAPAFQDLQLQQHRKLMERMKSKNQDRSSSQVSDSLSFGLGDDLKLTTDDVLSSSTAGLHSALEDANTRMREEMRELKDETGRLRKQLAEKNYEIKQLNKTIQKTQEDKKLLASAGVVTDTAAVKIVDLSKRNRELTAEVESEKTKSLKLLKRIAELERHTQDQSATTPRKKTSPRNTLALHPEAPIEHVEELQDKLQSSLIKMAEYRNQIQELKQELKIAHKVLQQEIGQPPASMQLLLSSGGSGFRGRSQQITALQDKVRDLEQKLKASSGFGNFSKPDKNMERIRNMEKQRKEQTEELRDQVARAINESAELQRKVDATKARNRVLVNETKSLKAQISVLTEKGSHDNELIRTLMSQQESLQRMVERSMSTKENVEKAEHVLSKQIHSKQQQEQAEVTRLKNLLTERDARVRNLEQATEELKKNAERNVVQQSGVLLAGNATGNRDMQKRIQDLQTQLAEYQALYKSTSLEYQKLTEMMNAQSKRLEKSTLSCQELNKSLSEEKRKSTRLESALENLKSSAKQDMLGKEASPSTARLPPEGMISELETMLSIQTDENAALKESLESTLRAKQEDIAVFHEMMEQTKTVFVDALKNLKSQ